LPKVIQNSTPVWHQIMLQGNQKVRLAKPPVDEQWVKDLNIFKDNSLDQDLVDAVMKEAEITTETLL